MNLSLSDIDHLNSTYTRENGTPMYQVVTPFSLSSRTATIKKAIPEFEQDTLDPRYGFLARVEFHIFSSSVLHIDGEEVKTSEFFLKGMPTMTTVTGSRKFFGLDGKEYEWILGQQTPTLVTADGKRTRIAEFHQKHHGIFSKARPPILEISPRGLHMVDLIFITFVYIEKLRRDRESRGPGNGGGVQRSQ